MLEVPKHEISETENEKVEKRVLQPMGLFASEDNWKSGKGV